MDGDLRLHFLCNFLPFLGPFSLHPSPLSIFSILPSLCPHGPALSAPISDKSHQFKCSFLWIGTSVCVLLPKLPSQPGSLTSGDIWPSSQTRRGWRGTVTLFPSDSFSLSQSVTLSPPLIYHLGSQPGCHLHLRLSSLFSRLFRHFSCSFSQTCLSYHSHNKDAMQGLSSLVLSPAASFPGQTQPWPTTTYPTCCYTHSFSSSSLLITFTTHLFPGLPWLPISTPCFMPGSYKRALRQGPPQLHISAASGS